MRVLPVVSKKYVIGFRIIDGTIPVFILDGSRVGESILCRFAIFILTRKNLRQTLRGSTKQMDHEYCVTRRTESESIFSALHGVNRPWGAAARIVLPTANIDHLPSFFMTVVPETPVGKGENECKSQSQTHNLSSFIAYLNDVLYNLSDAAVYGCRTRQRSLWRKNSPPADSSVVKEYAPPHLESQFEAMYRMFRPCLVQRDEHVNASAILQGCRGSGKTLLVNQCFQALRDELDAQSHATPPFRVVRVHGLLVPGDNVALVVREMLNQLANAAFEESQTDLERQQQQEQQEMEYNADEPLSKRAKSSRNRLERFFQLQSQKASFVNNIQLFNEVLQIAKDDNIPIVIVLDELDLFLGQQKATANSLDSGLTEHKDRQLLLYHLLDRVASDGSSVCFVGMTCHLGLIGLLEKRIRSRAEGTSQFLQFGPCTSIGKLRDIVSCKLESTRKDHYDAAYQPSLYHEIRALLTKPAEDDNHPTRRRVYNAFVRDCMLGQDVRWFSRVLTFAITNYRMDCLAAMEGDASSSASPIPTFDAEYLLEALADMGGSLASESGERDLVIVEDVAVDPRMQALRDLSGPQAALILATRRILSRDNRREQSNAVLTLERMLEEYLGSYKGSSNRYSKQVLTKAFVDLLSVGLLRPASDHSGGAPLQYQHDRSVLDLEPSLLQAVPLQLTVDVYRELEGAIAQNIMGCSTALREWGRKMN